MQNKANKSMEQFSLRLLVEQLPSSHKYAEKIIERASQNGIALTPSMVYNTIQGKAKINEPLIRRILEILIKESNRQVAELL